MNTEANIDPDDPRLSAYLLGELSAEETLVFEARLRHSPEAQAELDMMRTAIEMLRESFAMEWEEGMQDEDRPSLSLLPTPDVSEKVVRFDGGGSDSRTAERSRGRYPSRTVAVASLAAAVTIAAFVLPKPNFGTSTVVEATEASAPRSTEEGGLASAAVLADAGGTAKRIASSPEPVAIPAVKPVQEGKVLTVSAGLTQAGEAGEANPRPLGTDPTITEVRFLADDPIELRSVPLPAELLSYLPEGHGNNETVAYVQPSQAVLHRGANPLYLDTEKYPDPEIVHRTVELSGGVFRVDGDRGRALYRTEQRSDSDGRTSVIIKGVIRLDGGEEGHRAVVENEPDPGFEFGIMPVATRTTVSAEVYDLPSGGELRPAQLTKLPSESFQLGSSETNDLQGDDIATRYILRQQDRAGRAVAFADAGRRQLESGNFRDAASNLAMALEILPDAPATWKLRSQILERLEAANEAISE